MGLHGVNALQALLGLTHHRRHLVEHGKDVLHTSLVEHGDLHPMANQGCCNVGLQV